MKKLLITFLIGVTCTTTFFPPLHIAALCKDIPTNSAPAVKDSYKDRASVHIENLKGEFSARPSSGINDVDFLNSEISVLRTAIYISALIQSYITDEQLIDLAEEIVQENSGVIRESRILIDKLSTSNINQIQYLIEASKSLAKLINESTKDNIIKEMSQDIINNADSNLETITEIKPAIK